MKMSDRLSNQRGIGLISTGLVMTALLVATFVGVNIGRLAFTATEVQTVAEIAATAAATARLENKTQGEAIAEAQTVTQQNQTDGKMATVAASDIEFGNYTAGIFTPGGTPENAARATANATVKNLFAPLTIPNIISAGATSDVQKKAIANLVFLGSGQPSLPLGLCNCDFPADCLDDSCLPAWAHPSTFDTAAWTGFTTGSATNNVMSFIPVECGGDGETASVVAATDTTPGTMISINNGEISPAFVAVHCMWCEMELCTEASPCLLPVFACTCPGQLNQEAEVLGFAEIVIDSFHCTGGGSEGTICGCDSTPGQLDGISFHSVFRTNLTGSPGGGNFGAGFVALVG